MGKKHIFVLNRTQSFHAQAAGQVATLAEDFHQMEELYKRVCTMFGENYKQIEPDTLFQMLRDFAKAFQVLYGEFATPKDNIDMPISSEFLNLLYTSLGQIAMQHK